MIFFNSFVSQPSLAQFKRSGKKVGSLSINILPSLSLIEVKFASRHLSENKFAKNGLILDRVDLSVVNTVPPILNVTIFSSLESAIALCIASFLCSNVSAHLFRYFSFSCVTVSNSRLVASNLFSCKAILFSVALFSLLISLILSSEVFAAAVTSAFLNSNRSSTRRSTSLSIRSCTFRLAMLDYYTVCLLDYLINSILLLFKLLSLILTKWKGCEKYDKLSMTGDKVSKQRNKLVGNMLLLDKLIENL